MTRASFLNDNEYRQYPLVPIEDPPLDKDLIVDCGFITGLDSGYNPDTHVVYVAAVRRIGALLEVEFRATAPNLAGHPLIFRRSAAAEEWEEEYRESAAANLTCATEPLWSGFFVSGVVTTTFEKLNDGANVTFTAAQTAVEPARVQTLVKSYLRSVNVGNYARTAVPPCTGTEETIITPATEIIVNGTCISGHVKLKQGYNCQITQQEFNNTITILAVKDANTANPELCQNGSEIPLSSNEAKPELVDGEPEKSKFFSGGLACDQTITSINGLGGPDVKLAGGAGVQIVPDPLNPNGLLIRIQENIVNKTC